MDKKERYLGYMLYRAQLSEKVAITESRESTLGNHCSNFFPFSFVFVFHYLFCISYFICFYDQSL